MSGAQAAIRVILTGEDATLLGIEGITDLLIKSGMEEGKARATATVFYLMAAVGTGIKTGNAYDNLDKSKLPKGIDDTIAKLQDDIHKNADSIPSNQVDEWIDEVERALDDTPNGGAAVAPRSFLSADDFASLPRSGRIDPKKIRFSQDSISAEFKGGVGGVDDLAAKLKAGQVDPSTIPPIRIVVRDGKVWTLDNRRLRAFQEAGIEIPFERLDSIPKSELFKFTTTNDGVEIIIRGAR